MSKLDRFFEKKAPRDHPKVAYWRSVVERGEVESLRVTFMREREGLSFGPAKLYVHFLDAAGEEISPPDEVAWDERVNAALVRLRAAAESLENEGDRFGMVMNDRFATVANRFGDGFFNAVLAQYLKESPWAEIDECAQLIAGLREAPASRGRQRTECAELIEEVIGYCIDALYETLKYSRPQTISTVGHALAYYLDERFHVSTRKMMGWS